MTFCNLSEDFSEYFAGFIHFFFFFGLETDCYDTSFFTIHTGNYIKAFGYLISLLHNKLILDRGKNVKGSQYSLGSHLLG